MSFQDILYYFKARRFWGKLYPSNDKLDVLNFYLDEIGIKSITHEKQNLNFVTIEFEDGTICDGWCENKWFAWFSIGKLAFSNGEKFDWHNEMPNYKVLYKLKKAIDKDNEDFSKYLPKGYAKKMERLKKLEKLDKNLR